MQRASNPRSRSIEVYKQIIFIMEGKVWIFDIVERNVNGCPDIVGGKATNAIEASRLLLNVLWLLNSSKPTRKYRPTDISGSTCEQLAIPHKFQIKRK